MDRMVLEMEQETYAVDDMIANIESLNFNDDIMLNDIERQWNAIHVPDTLDINGENFTGEETSRRPTAWRLVSISLALR